MAKINKAERAIVVQKTATKPALVDDNGDWKWSKQRRKAVELVVKGYSDTQISKETGMHRNTIRAWRKNRIFFAAVVDYARDYMDRVRFKRIYETGTLTDEMAVQVAQRLKELKDRPKGKSEMNQNEVMSLSMFLREYREFRNMERADFGDNAQRIDAYIHMEGQDGKNRASEQSFKRLIEANVDGVSSSQDLIALVANVITKTSILEDIHQEDLVEGLNEK